jgi:uncharacterized membrane protein
MYPKKYFIIFFIFICVWCFGIISPIFFHNVKTFLIAKPFLNQVYGTVCHQSQEKTISIGEENIFVCSRCAGIYLGVLLSGLISLILTKTHRKIFYFLLLTFALLLLDVLFSTLKIYTYSKVIALLTGLFWGSTLLLFVLDQLNFFKTQSNYEK